MTAVRIIQPSDAPETPEVPPLFNDAERAAFAADRERAESIASNL